MVNAQIHLYVCEGLDDRFAKKDFVVHDKSPYFSEPLSFNLPSLLVNQALLISAVT